MYLVTSTHKKNQDSNATDDADGSEPLEEYATCAVDKHHRKSERHNFLH